MRDRAVAVVAFGGGHGLHASLSALRLLVDELVVDDLTAVVTVADNGGSSGRLRHEFGVLPPGDLRMALAALCGRNEWGVTWSRVLQHRFAGDGEMRDHVIGNLLIVGLWELLGDHVDALDYVGRLLGATGRARCPPAAGAGARRGGGGRWRGPGGTPPPRCAGWCPRIPRRWSRCAARWRSRAPTGSSSPSPWSRPTRRQPRRLSRRSRPPTGSCSGRGRGSPR